MERRKYPRIIVSSGVVVNAERCPIVNLSVGGALFTTVSPYAVGTLLALNISPIVPQSRVSAHTLQGRVLRCEKGVEGKYAVAVKFEQAGDEYVAEVLAAISSGTAKQA